MVRKVLQLADKILDLVQLSGLSISEAQCAIQAASLLVRVEPEPPKIPLP